MRSKKSDHVCEILRNFVSHNIVQMYFIEIKKDGAIR